MTPKTLINKLPKKDLHIVPSYLGKLSFQICTRINHIMENILLDSNIRFVFQSKCKISNFFTFKGKVPSLLHSDIVYKFQCGSCSATYCGKLNVTLMSECV